MTDVSNHTNKSSHHESEFVSLIIQIHQTIEFQIEIYLYYYQS